MSTTSPTRTPDRAADKQALADEKRRGRGRARGLAERPGFLIYGLLMALFLGGSYPLWW